MRSHILTLLVIALLANLAPASLGGDLWVVQAYDDPWAGFLLADTVAAAADGDTILVYPWVALAPYVLPWYQVTIDGKSLTLVGMEGSLDDGDGRPDAGVRFINVRNLQEGQTVVLRNLTMDTSMPPPLLFDFDWGPAVDLIDNAGHVRLEGCRLIGENGSKQPSGQEGADPLPKPGLRCVACDDVVVVRCRIDGGPAESITNTNPFTTTPGHGGAGIVCTDTAFGLYESDVRGAAGGHILAERCEDAGLGGHGLVVTGGSAFVSGCTVRAGGGGRASAVPGACGGAGGDGGDGLVGASLVVRQRASTFTAGLAGDFVPGLGVPGTAGVDVTLLNATLVDLQGAPRSLTVTSPATQEQQVWFLAQGERQDVVLVLVALDAGQVDLPGMQEQLLVGIATPATLLLLGTIQAVDGALLVKARAPSMPPGVDAFDLHVQGLFVAEDGEHLGSASTLTVLAMEP